MGGGESSAPEKESIQSLRSQHRLTEDYAKFTNKVCLPIIW